MRGIRLGLISGLLGLLISCGGSADSGTAPAAVAATTAAATSVDTEPAAAVIATSVPPAVTEAIVVTDDSAPSASVVSTDLIDATVAPESTDPQFSGDGSSRFCDLIRELDESSPLDSAFGNSTTPEATKASWDQVMAVFGPLRETAPAEIAADVAVATGFIEVMDRIFVENDYNMEEIAIALESDPELTDMSDGGPEIDAATDRIDAYGVQVCGLAS